MYKNIKTNDDPTFSTQMGYIFVNILLSYITNIKWILRFYSYTVLKSQEGCYINPVLHDYNAKMNVNGIQYVYIIFLYGLIKNHHF